jgi:hypothetical protein
MKKIYLKMILSINFSLLTLIRFEKADESLNQVILLISQILADKEV